MWLKLNVDGGLNGNPSPTCCWGIIWDDCGHALVSFVHSYGVSTNMLVEEHTLSEGLKMAQKLCIRNLLVELDSKVIIG